jgi:Ser/Thr protein kinase RdoA (MazF antagonist)
VWRVQTARGACCLRGWPAGDITPQRLGWRQRQLVRISRSGCDIVPLPLAARHGATWVGVGERLWELSTWLPGQADYATAPCVARLVSAARAVASFHTAAARHEGSPAAPVPALSHRLALIDKLQHGLWSRLRAAPLPPHCPGLAPRAATILAHYARSLDGVAQRLRAAQAIATPLQVCHGDLWHDHVLFSAETVTGLVDFDAMRVDARATDIARLFGSLAGDDAEAWRVALAAYEQVAPLREDEQTLIRVLDQSAVLLSGMSWLRWLLLEHRQFPAWERVLQRLDAIIRRLRQLA